MKEKDEDDFMLQDQTKGDEIFLPHHFTTQPPCTYLGVLCICEHVVGVYCVIVLCVVQSFSVYTYKPHTQQANAFVYACTHTYRLMYVVGCAHVCAPVLVYVCTHTYI